MPSGLHGRWRGNERDPEDLAEPIHLGGNLRIRAAAVGHDGARVLDDAARTGAVHEREDGIEKDPALEAGKGGVILDEDEGLYEVIEPAILRLPS